jgi:hypothetical protein
MPRRLEPVEDVEIADLLSLFDSATHYYRLLSLLGPRLGGWVSRDEIYTALYGRPDGGPLDATGVVSSTVFQLRKRIAGYGFTVQGRKHRGASAYRLLRTNGDVVAWNAVRSTMEKTNEEDLV